MNNLYDNGEMYIRMNKKLYLVISNYSNESNGSIDIENIYVYKTYESAKKKFEEIKKEIISFDLQYDDIEDREDYYCEWETNEYLYYHELVMIKESVLNE